MSKLRKYRRTRHGHQYLEQRKRMLLEPSGYLETRLNEKGEVTRNKERLVCKGHAQEGKIDCWETFSLVARLEGVRNFLAYVAYKGFKVYEMNVKFAFLNGILEEGVYIEQIEGFFDPNKRDIMYKMNIALYRQKKPLKNGMKGYKLI